VAETRGRTPLVGREQEVALLRARWAQVKDGSGQVVLLSGEAGIGKSRLVQMLTEHVAAELQAWLTSCQCSPYHQNTALYPMIELLERVALRFEREESPSQKLRKLEGFVAQYGLPLAETVPLLATLLSLPLTADDASLTTSPAQQKQQTLHAILTILLRIAAQQPVLFVMEDLHWVDPTTLEFLSLLVDQGPTTRILALCTCRPDFTPPWTGRAHLTQITVNRLPRHQAEEMTSQIVHGKALPPEVMEQVVAKTDGVPLFVEELTKMVLESSLLQERDDHYELTGLLPPLAIPATLQDSLMARLDRLETVKALAQLGATLGREFSYELLQAVAPWDEGTLQRGLQQLVEAEFLYQQGLPPQATYLFKHALIQDAAYQALLKSTRQQYHQRIAQVLVERFPDMVEKQPELVAQHYTEAGVAEYAMRYWQQAGHVAQARWAHDEAIAYLTTGLAMLMTLPETRERDGQELTVRINLGKSLAATKGWAAPEAEANSLRAWEICQQASDTPQLLEVLWGLAHVYIVRADLPKHREVGARMRALAEQQSDTLLLLMAHWLTAQNLLHAGEFPICLAHLEQAYTLYDSQHHHTYVTLFGVDIGVFTLAYMSHALWNLGYPEQAVQRSHQALALAEERQHPFSKALAQAYAAMLQQFRREPHTANAHAEVATALCIEHDFAYYRAWAMIIQGWCLWRRGQPEAGVAQMQEGITALRATGGEVRLSYYFALLAEGHGEDHKLEVGLRLLTEAFAHQVTTQERWTEAELYRLKGELLLKQTPPDEQQVEACFQQALAIACRQEAKSLELRAALSLARLWQQQGKQAEAFR
jgi:predicted ATPase